MDIHGIVIVDKPEGPTSHDVVAQARRYFGTRRVGHAGTLDPMASGVLLLLLGEATKLSSYLTLEQKSYEATVTFGTSTDTDDAEGTTLETVQLGSDWLDDRRLAEALELERARTAQVPPRVTAIKQGGIRAHQRHRLGLDIDTTEREVRVFELRLLDRSASSLTLTLTVSKGYYVRSLARDLGLALGVPAHLSKLRRSQSGAFPLAEAIPWPPREPPTLLPVADVARRVLPHLTLTEEGVSRARVGKLVGREQFVCLAGEPELPPPDVAVAWLSEDGALVAIGQFDEAGVGRVSRGFVPDSAPKLG